MKYTVYVIEDKVCKRYTGYTSNLEKRLWQHNNGLTRTTRQGIDWKLVYKKEFETKIEAIKYEKYLKTGKGRNFLKQYCGIV